MSRLSSLRQLYLTRLREFYRQPARIFWVYGFPTILAIVLGLAFKNQKPQPVTVDVAPAPRLPIEDVKVGKDRQGAVYLSIHEPNLDRVLSALRDTSSAKGQRWRPPIEVTPRPFDQAID
ncbi:MAG TPA: hypothetical protein VFT74_00170, partial [Isosphaeraceae bacterium]|nr:hypothetical protein [Isosphaeraceae bacterium]